MDKGYTKERIVLLTQYFIEDGKPITAKQLQRMVGNCFDEIPNRKTIYSDLTVIDIVLGLKRETRTNSAGRGYEVYWSYNRKN